MQGLNDQMVKAKLVFFDNVYMYDPAFIGNMTEETPVNPKSRKGKIRSRLAKLVNYAHKKGDVQTTIARSADFYGPGVKDVSVLTETMIKPLSEGKKASILGKPKAIHSFTFTRDAGKATALLGNSPEAFGEIWHLPTAPDPWTQKEYLEFVAKELGKSPKYRKVNKFMLGLIGLFVPVMKEFIEMYYQYDRDYVFISDKFENSFGFKPTSYEEGIRQTVAEFNQ
jgi:nucleoside-diphosphate-sugar epimerase